MLPQQEKPFLVGENKKIPLPVWKRWKRGGQTYGVPFKILQRVMPQGGLRIYNQSNNKKASKGVAFYFPLSVCIESRCVWAKTSLIIIRYLLHMITY